MADYKVEHISNDLTPTVTDISDFVHSVDYVKRFSDGRVSVASLTLKSSFGWFMTNSNGGKTPILANFDRLRLTGIGQDSNQYSHIFEIMDDLGQLNKQSEYLLPLTLEGRERAMSLIPVSGIYDNLSHFDMAEQILKTYNISIIQGIQPRITGGSNNLLPKYNPNIWDFQYIDNCLDALKEDVRLANQSVSAGGGGDRFAIIFEDSDSSPFTDMNVKIISQGTNNQVSNRPTIRANELTNPITHIPRVIQPPTGTVVVARGKPGSGGVPVDGDKYRSRLEFWQQIRDRQTWDPTINYKKDAYVGLGGNVYQALDDNINEQPPSAFWQNIFPGEYIGDLQYSGFTKDKAKLYKNECTNPHLPFASEIEASPKMLDCNIVINDVETQRDWVWIRQITDNVNSWSENERHYLFKKNNIYEGFRILVDVSNLGPASGAFDAAVDSHGTGAGNDPNGKPYANNQCVFVKGKWYVMREHENFDQTLVRFEGLFEWNVNFAAKSQYPANDTDNTNRRYRRPTAGTPDGWRILNEQFLANDCLHSPTTIENTEGLITPHANSFGGGNYTDDSAVRIVYSYGTDKADMPEWREMLDRLLGIATIASPFLGSFATTAIPALYDLFLTPFYRNAGWWITLSAPFPFSTHDDPPEQVGELYGAGTAFNVSQLNDHSTFDAYNQRATFTGKESWNKDDSNGMMEITGVTFLFRLNITNNGETIPFTGDIPCSYWVIDDNGTIWKQKKKIRHLDNIQRLTFNFSEFSPVYRARTPFGINKIVTNILTPELEIRERLFPNRIRIQGFQLEAPYDEHGRYMPNIWETIIKPTVFTMFNPTTTSNFVEFIGDIDYFQWIKTPIAIARDSNAVRAIFPEFKDYPNISNFEQLQRAADADIDVETFQYEQYEITRFNKADIELQDTVYLFEPNMINFAEAPIPTTAPNWSSSASYVINDVVDNVGSTFICIRANVNQAPPDTEYWVPLTAPEQHTRELTVGEINWSVTKDKDVQFTHVLIRRIPKIP